LSSSTGKNPNSVGNLKGVSATNIKRWKKEFENDRKNFGKDLREEKCGRKVKYPELDNHLKDWFIKLRGAKVAVSGLMILNEAQSYIDLHKLEGLNLSHCWLWKLLKRLNIVKRKSTKIAQKSASAFEAEIINFVSLITELR